MSSNLLKSIPSLSNLLIVANIETCGIDCLFNTNLIVKTRLVAPQKCKKLNFIDLKTKCQFHVSKICDFVIIYLIK